MARIVFATREIFSKESELRLSPASNPARDILEVCYCVKILQWSLLEKAYGFLMFSGGRERVHWEQRG